MQHSSFFSGFNILPGRLAISQHLSLKANPSTKKVMAIIDEQTFSATACQILTEVSSLKEHDKMNGFSPQLEIILSLKRSPFINYRTQEDNI